MIEKGISPMTEIDLSKVLTKEAVTLDHEPFASKEEMFDFMSKKFLDAGIITDQKAYIQALEEREEMGPTYMGNYIGLPHGRCNEVISSGIGFCRCKEPFTYQSCGETGEVKYVFMLAIPGSQSGEQYMRVLATLAGLLAKEEFVDHLDDVHNYEELMELVKTCSEE